MVLPTGSTGSTGDFDVSKSVSRSESSDSIGKSQVSSDKENSVQARTSSVGGNILTKSAAAVSKTFKAIKGSIGPKVKSKGASVDEIDQSLNKVTKANVNNIDPATGGTPLHLAVMNGRLESVKTLIGLGADVNLKSRAGSPLDVAKQIRDAMPDGHEMKSTMNEIIALLQQKK